MKLNKPNFTFRHPHSPYAGEADFHFDIMWVKIYEQPYKEPEEVLWYKLVEVEGLLMRVECAYHDYHEEYDLHEQFKNGIVIEYEGINEIQAAYEQWLVEKHFTTVRDQ